MNKKSITPKIKNGTICTLSENNLIVFRLVGKNYKLGYPYGDVVMFRGELTTGGGCQTVAYTNKWEEATPAQKEKFISECKKHNIKL